MKTDKVANKEIFSGIYITYFPKLLRFSHFYILSEEEAENIVQDIFADLWSRMEILDGIQNIDAFLFTLVKNKCIDYLRRQLSTGNKKHKLLDVTGKEYEFKLFSLQQVDEALLSVDDVEKLLQNAIEKLPERCREIFVLSRIDGLKNREIAEQLQISVRTVENQMAIAIRKLKSELRDYLPILLFFF